ncbi:MAG: hypothetical protein UV57_C0037G0018, partial [Parcubacteria group bacterium GW2011_GWD2_43_10]
MTWTDPGALAVKWNSIVAPSGNQSLAMGANTSAWTFNSLTTGTGLTASTSSLTTGNLFSLASTSTAADTNSQTILNIVTSGTNDNSTQTTYGLQVANTHTGTSSTNVAGYFTASGANNNYGLIVAAGNVGIGTTVPGSKLEVADTSVLASESLTNPNLTSGTSWTQTGDMALATDAATYTHSTGSGTLEQTSGT